MSGGKLRYCLYLPFSQHLDSVLLTSSFPFRVAHIVTEYAFQISFSCYAIHYILQHAPAIVPGLAPLCEDLTYDSVGFIVSA